MQINLKKLLPYVAAILVFIGISIAYCAPALDGKVLYAGDTNNWKGAAHEAKEHLAATGESPYWTNSMFGGMPTYQITYMSKSGKVWKAVKDATHLGFEDEAAIGLIFAYFCGFFVLLLCFGVNPWLSIAGALAIGFSSYFFLIIPAGHITKAVGLAYLAPMIGGIYAIFRKKRAAGAAVFIIYGILGITQHPQMTYYVCMLLGIMGCAELYIHIKDKAWKDLGISLGVLICCALLIFGTKLSWMQMNQSYLKETMRGGHSELTKATDEANKTTGLDLDYATAWSYGKGETMTLLIPNWEGGASGYNVGNNSTLYDEMISQRIPKKSAEQFCRQAPTYRGEKAFTSGPVYAGAIICFLFVLALLIVPGPYKWALLIATLCSIFLSWGRNMMWLTELFFQYFPMYNKFRAVESILIVAEITIPLLGFLGLQQIVEHKMEWKKLQKNLFIAGGITAGICLLAWLCGGAVDVTSTYDSQWKSQMPEWLTEAIYAQRTAMLKADALRSLIFVLLGFGLVYLYAWKTKDEQQKKWSVALFAGLALLVIADMLPVNKRFFAADNFVTQKESDRFFQIQPYEEQILKDQTLDFRTINLASNTFNDSRTSYRLKSIGGYSAVKLRRYQDLIDMHISHEMNPMMQTIMRTNGFMMPDEHDGNDFPVLNMLNTRYAVVPLQGGQQMAVKNPYAMGNAWFVNDVMFVDNADEECAALSAIDLHTQAVADKQFAEALSISGHTADGSSSITLLSYLPNQLVYEAMTETDKVAVFSEIYYPREWHLYIDEQEMPLARVNYILRGAVIPAGKHTIRMEFVPDSLSTDNWCMWLMIFAFLLSAALLAFGYVRTLHKKVV